MTDTTQEPIVVNENAGGIDAIQAALRYIGVIVTAVIAVFGLLKTKDIAGLMAFVQANGGAVLAAISGLVGIATAAYGIFKTHKRGAQIATVAGDSRVPNSVATTSS